MKSVGYFILLCIFTLMGCSFGRRSCVNDGDHVFIDRKNYLSADCTVTYSDSRKQVIDLPKDCHSAVVINSGSGNLLVRSAHVLDVLTIINHGSNNADIHDVQANKVVLQDRGSGVLLVSALEEITGVTHGSGTIIVSGPGKNNVVNKGSGSILWSQF